MIFNIIDWIGDGVEPYAESINACKYRHGGYVGRMQKYLGAAEQSKKTRTRKREGKERTQNEHG